MILFLVAKFIFHSGLLTNQRIHLDGKVMGLFQRVAWCSSETWDSGTQTKVFIDHCICSLFRLRLVIMFPMRYKPQNKMDFDPMEILHL